MDHAVGNPRHTRSLIPGLVLSGIAVAVLVAVADPARAFRILLTARPTPLVGATVALGLGLVARAAASRELVDARVSFGASFAALNLGYLANNLLPLRVGEVVRSVVLGRRSRLGIIGGATAVGAERLLDVVLAAVILIAALPAVGVDAGWAPPLAAAATAVTAVAVLVAVAHHRRSVIGWLEPRLATRPRLARALPRLSAALEGLARPRRLARAIVWLVLSWSAALGFFWLVLRAFIPEAPLVWAAFAIGVLAFGIALPSSPGAVGVYEAALVGALSLCEVEAADALAFAVTAHALSFAVTSLFGLGALLRLAPGRGGLAGALRGLVDGRDLPAAGEAK